MRTADIEPYLRPEGRTAGELIDFADAVPRELVIPVLAHYARRAERLLAGNGVPVEDRPPARQLFVLGTLVNRALFDVLNLPQDRAYVFSEDES